MGNEILMVVDAVSREKGVEREVIFAALEAALATATRKRHREDIDVRVSIHRDTGTYDTFRRWEVIPDEAETVEFPDRQLKLSEAQARHLTIHGVNQNEDGTYSWKFDNYIRAHWLTRAFAIQAAARVMALHGRGKIVAVGTDAGRVATVGESFIGGATAGMMQMCRVLARELGRDGIRVNAVAMSYIWDAEPRWGPGSPALEGGHGKGMIENLRKRMLFPVHCQDIANAAAFLAGPESDAITGQTLSVNGGLSTPG